MKEWVGGWYSVAYGWCCSREGLIGLVIYAIKKRTEQGIPLRWVARRDPLDIAWGHNTAQKTTKEKFDQINKDPS